MKIFLDANIIFSAVKKDSFINKLIFLLSEKHKLISSNYAILEARKNLSLKKLFSLGEFNRICSAIKVHDPIILSGTEFLPDKDKAILGAAISAKCDYLLTGDKKHFGDSFGKKVRGVVIVNPTKLAEEIF